MTAPEHSRAAIGSINSSTEDKDYVIKDINENNESKNDNTNEDNGKMNNDGAVTEHTGTIEKKSLRFWAIILSLAVTGLLTALEATITSTALPTIIDSLGGASLYVWVINLYFLTM